MQDYYSIYTWAMDKQAQMEREAAERHRRQIIDAIPRLINQIRDRMGGGLGDVSQSVRHFSSLSFL